MSKQITDKDLDLIRTLAREDKPEGTRQVSATLAARLVDRIQALNDEIEALELRLERMTAFVAAPPDAF